MRMTTAGPSGPVVLRVCKACDVIELKFSYTVPVTAPLSTDRSGDGSGDNTALAAILTMAATGFLLPLVSVGPLESSFHEQSQRRDDTVVLEGPSAARQPTTGIGGAVLAQGGECLEVVQESTLAGTVRFMGPRRLLGQMTASLTLGRIGLLRRSDEDVFSRALGGDPVAFSEVYRRYSKRIYGYCLARLMEPEAAADAAQEVFLRFLDADRQGIEQPRAWLFGVARHVTIDAIRKRSRTPEPTDGEVIERAVGASGADTADEALSRDDARNVFVALRRLRPRYREALILRELHHETSADMADALDTTPGAVDTLVSRARDAFGRAYGEVLGLPTDCADAVAAIYKRKGSGLDAAEEGHLQAHLVACPHCHKESVRASRADGLSALLPFLVPGKRIGLNLIERATLALRSSADLVPQLGTALPPDRLAPALKVAAAVLTLSLVVAVPTIRPVTPSRPGGSPGVAMAATFAPKPSVGSAAAVPPPRCGCLSPAQRLLNECGKPALLEHRSSCPDSTAPASSGPCGTTGSSGACDSHTAPATSETPHSTSDGESSHSTSGSGTSHSEADGSGSHSTAGGSTSHSTSGGSTSHSTSGSGATSHESAPAPSGTAESPVPPHDESAPSGDSGSESHPDGEHSGDASPDGM